MELRLGQLLLMALVQQDGQLVLLQPTLGLPLHHRRLVALVRRTAQQCCEVLDLLLLLLPLLLLHPLLPLLLPLLPLLLPLLLLQLLPQLLPQLLLLLLLLDCLQQLASLQHEQLQLRH